MDNKIYDLLQHYNGLGVKKYSQLWEYARALDYGTDVYMGGGEYCQTQDINNKQKYYELIFNAYNELKDYEQVIKEDYNSLTEREWFCRSEECKAVEAMYYICKVYHDEIEYITEYIGLGQKSGKADVIKNRLSSEWQAKLKLQQETEREKKYFAKAIEAGLMEKDGDSYRWLHNNGLKASLGYFLNRVFNPKGTAQIPCKRLGVLFGVTRLDTVIYQAVNPKKPQKWRTEIDNLFDD